MVVFDNNKPGQAGMDAERTDQTTRLPQLF